MTANPREPIPFPVRALPKRSQVQQVAAVPGWSLPEGLEGLAVGGADLLREAERPADFAVDGLIEAEDVVLVTGREKDALKTWLLLSFAVARVLGGMWLGFRARTAPPARVLFVSTETSPRNIARRLMALCRGLDIPVDRVAPYIYVVAEPVTVLPRGALERARRSATVRNVVAALKIGDADRRAALERNIDEIAEGEARRLGSNLDALAAILDAPPGTWAAICLDTLRQCLEGDENSSADAARFTQGCRELARAARCPVLVSHHTNKSGDASDARSSRGSVELTAGPDVLVSVDTSGEYPTAHFKLRNHESPAAVGYRLAVDPQGAVRLDVLQACGRPSEANEDDVLTVLRDHAGDGLSVSKIRTFVAAAKGGKPGAKANQNMVEARLAALVAKGLASPCKIRRRNGEEFDGFRIGPSGGVVEAKPLQRTLAEAMGDPTNV